MAVRYTCTADGCGWEFESIRQTREHDAEIVDVHRASHVDPSAQGTPPLPDTVRSRTHFRWVRSLAITNLAFVLLALVGGFGGSSFAVVGLIFPQVAGWWLPFGWPIGVVCLLAIGVSAVIAATSGVDSVDRRYRAFAATTMSSFIMFLACAAAPIAMLVLLSGIRP